MPELLAVGTQAARGWWMWACATRNLYRVQTMKAETFGREGLRAVRARIELGDNVFVNFNGQWEWYGHYKSGSSKGLERFLGYVTAPAHLRVLNQVFVPANYRLIPACREQLEREALIEKMFAPGLAAKRADARMALEGEGGFFTAVTPERRAPSRSLKKDC